jgi:hypothetical protein
VGDGSTAVVGRSPAEVDSRCARRNELEDCWWVCDFCGNHSDTLTVGADSNFILGLNSKRVEDSCGYTEVYIELFQLSTSNHEPRTS